MGWDSTSEVGLKEREIVGPSGVLWMSQWVRRVLMRDWAPSRARLWRSAGERVCVVAEGVGRVFGSVPQRWARS